ncbi:Hsp33 family molecular chaperone HslO [Clostridia bacterium]|nr:Hsp33 family molecular chaperone HslO [Clostridia bacterium]
MADYLISATAEGQARAFVIQSTEIVEHARIIHDLYPTSADALGRLLTATALMGHTLKSKEDSITLRVMGDGPLGAIISVGDKDLNVRGYVNNPHVTMPIEEYGKFAFANAVGMGNLFVTRDLGLKEPYTGSVPLTSGEIASDISEYYLSSEQIPTACGLGVYIETDGTVQGAGGFLVQLLPGADEEFAKQLEKNALAMPVLSELFKEGKTPEYVLTLLFSGLEYKINEKKEVAFQCVCSKEKYSEILGTLKTEAIEEMIREDHGAEAVCSFCNKRYQFSEEELKIMLQEKKRELS